MYTDATMLEPEIVRKQWFLQVDLRHGFYGNHYCQLGVTLFCNLG